MPQLTWGKAAQKDYPDFMKVIKQAFSIYAPDPDFELQHPRFYPLEKWLGHDSTYALWEDGKLAAAVSSLHTPYQVLDNRLDVAVLGNMAVGEAYRGKGYMRPVLDEVLKRAKEDGMDMVMLTGNRLRYRNYGFEWAGSQLAAMITPHNVKHAAFAPVELTLRPIKATDTAVLAQVNALLSTLPMYPLRGEAGYLALKGWIGSPYAAFDGKDFAGYFVISNIPLMRSGTLEVSEFMVTKPQYAAALGAAILRLGLGETATVYTQPYNPCAAALLDFCERVSVHSAWNWRIFSYERVLSLLLPLRALAPMADGRLVLDITNFGGRERLLIEVEKGVPHVAPTQAPPHMTLDFAQATQLLFGHACHLKAQLPAEAASWLPVPLSASRQDLI